MKVSDRQHQYSWLRTAAHILRTTKILIGQKLTQTTKPYGNTTKCYFCFYLFSTFADRARSKREKWTAERGWMDCAHCIASWAQEQSKCKNSNNNNDHDRTMYKTFSQKDRLTPTVRCWKATHSNVIITMWQCNRPYDSIYIYIYSESYKKKSMAHSRLRAHTHTTTCWMASERASEFLSRKGIFQACAWPSIF